MSRILLVEDDPEVRLLVEHVLFDAGYDVDASSTFDGASGLLEGRDYDLLVVDARLPDGSGVTLAEAARRQGTRAVIMTGYAFVLDEPGVDLARYEVLLKPISPEELLATIEKTLTQA